MINNDPTDKVISATDARLARMTADRLRLLEEQKAMTFEMPAPRATAREGRRYRSHRPRKRRTLR